MKRTLKLLSLLVLCLCIAMSIGVFGEEAEMPMAFGSKMTLRSIVADVTENEIKMSAVNGLADGKDSPAIFFNNGLDIDTSVYRYIVLEMETDITLGEKGFASHAIYFKTDLQPGFSESKKVSLNMQLKSDGHVKYIFDMGKNEAWTGKCTSIFYSFSGNVFGTASMKNLRFVKGDAIKRIEMPEEERLTNLPQPERVLPVSSFSKTRAYSDSFADVKITDWFYESVVSAYEFGLVNGSSDTAYNPNGTMTVAEAVTLASRLHSTNNKDGKAEKITGTNPWYQGYVDYAKSEGFLKDGDFDSYTRPVKRWEMVKLFADSLPESVFNELNYITHIPDVSKDKAYADALYMFYNAGICMGSDIYGTFNPESNIRRSEVAAIVSRICDLNKRLDQELAVKVNSDSAFWLVDDNGYTARNTISNSLQSGWDYDIRGSMPKSDDEPPYSLSDISATEPVTLTRTLTLQDSGVVTTAPASLKFNSTVDGWYMQTLSSDEAPVYKLFTKNGEFYVLDGGKEVATGFKVETGKTCYIKIVTDIDNKKNTYIVNNEDLGTYGFASKDAVNMQTYMAGTTEKATGDFGMGALRMYANFVVNEYLQSSDYIPYDWKADGDVTVKSGEFLFTGKEGKTSVTKNFEKTSGKVALRFIVLYPEKANGFTAALTSEGKNVLTFKTQDSKMFIGSKELRNCTNNMWYMVRIVADTETQTAEIKVSGKTIAKDVPFEIKADTLDGLVLSTENLEGSTVRVDDITLEPVAEYENYPEEPKVPEGADDYYIGMNVCDLWQNGYHWGWDNISPYDENKPYLGWYDGSLPEVADWEIKFFAEHGVDFRLVCWYHSAEKPMKTFYGNAPKAVFDGFMNAKYSDEYGKFALLWEAANGQRPSGLEDFKTRFCDFWFEYFFTDPRYMVIDNKLVMSIFGPDKLKESFGNAQGVREAFEYLDKRVKDEIGYDGIIIMACSSSTDSNSLSTLANMGIDAVHAYGWGKTGYLATVNQDNIANQQKNGQEIIHNVPTLSVGFNNIAWAYTRQHMMTVENMEQTLLWIRDKALPRFELKGDDDWKHNFVMLSTWNEYGEGTYMMPSGLNGFGYLDTVRKVFTKNNAHTDVRPDNLQTARLGHLYPINREIIRPEGYLEASNEYTLLYEESFTQGWNTSGSIQNPHVENGMLVGTSNSTDPMMHSQMLNGPINSAEVKQLVVWVDSPVGDQVQVYFLTDEDKTWNAAKGVIVNIEKEGLNPVVVNVGSVNLWKGSIVALRIDPLTSARTFKAQKVQFYGEKQTEKLLINSVEHFCDIPNVKTENDLLLAFYPDTGIGYKLGCKYTWDKVGKKLTLTKNGVEIVFTVGSNMAMVSGKPVKLPEAIRTADGVPMIPIHFVVEKFGCRVETKEENGIKITNIITAPADVYDVISTRKNNQWEFNLDGDVEGFGLQSLTGSVTDGVFKGVAKESGGKYDPALNSVELKFPASEYSKLIIRMKHSIDVPKTDENAAQFCLTLYFATDSAGLAESRTFKKYIEQSSNGEFVEYSFDLQNHKEWKGTITKIRLDPFNNVPGSFEIDYIRFIK